MPIQSPQQHRHRARRIPAEQWEAQRELLTKLYLEDEASHREIVQIMARQHRFNITYESSQRIDVKHSNLADPKDNRRSLTADSKKQLKDRFRKWAVKKYISEVDMGILLSLRDHHQTARHCISFEYRGHMLGTDRIERVFKRWKGSVVPCDSVPDYIKMICLERQTSLEDRKDDASNQASSAYVATPLNSVPENFELGLSSDVGFDDSLNFMWDPGLFESQPSSHASNASDSRIIPGLSDSRDLQDSQSIGQGFGRDSAQELQLTYSDDGLDLERQQNRFHSDHSEITSSTEVGACTTDFNWAELVGLPATVSSPYAALTLTREITRCGELPSQTSESQDSPSNTGLATSGPEISGDLVRRCQPDPPSAPPKSRDAESFNSDGCDPEMIVELLGFMKSHLSNSMDYDMLDWYTFQGPTLSDLLDLIHSRWLSLAMEDLLCYIWESCSRAVRQRQAARREEISGNPSHARAYRSRRNDVQSSSDDRTVQLGNGSQLLQARYSSYLLSTTQKGALRIQLKAQRPDSFDSNSGHILAISAMPKAKKRTAGLLAMFTIPVGSIYNPQIPPCIETFNVVPHDSEIIQCVSRNDVRGVQSLFDAGKASPLDVDPFGFSLLSYAMYTGCSEVFLLLLQGGAGTQNCDRYGKTLDVVWAIWSTFADYHSRSLPPECYASGATRDLDQCIRMTDAALQKGCDIEGSICHDPKTANALFEIGDWWSLEATHRAAPEKSIEYLINVGYDIEARNAGGLTPLLYTATTCKAHAVISLATFIRKGANVRAIDLAGRNALHCALAAPQIFDDWKSMRLVGFAEHTISNHYFLPAYVYHTQSLAHAEDYEDQLGDHEVPQVDAEENLFRRQPNDRCQCGFQAGDDLSEGQAVNDPRIGIPTIVCNDFAGAEHTIRHPIQVLKMRMRFRLLTLLNANCDPNVFDKAGATPSDYARRDGLWPQWSWALIKAGFEYNVGGDRWVRRYTL